MEKDKSLTSLEPEDLKYRYFGQTLVDELTAPTPPEWIEDKPGKGGSAQKYVPGPYFINKLNNCFGFLWGFRIVDSKLIDTGKDPLSGQTKKQVVACGELEVTIPGRIVETKYPDGRVETTKWDTIKIVKSQYGRCDVKLFSKDGSNYRKGDLMDIGNDFKGAATDALKKGATQFGIAMDVYSSRETAEEKEREKLASSSQLEAFYMRAKGAGMEEEAADKWCEEEIGKVPAEAQYDQVMSLIPKLVKMAQEKK